MKDPELRDNPPNPDAARRLPQGAWASTTRSCTSTTCAHPDIHPMFRELRGVLDAYERATADRAWPSARSTIFDWPALGRLLRREPGRAAPAVQLRPARTSPGTAQAVRALVDALRGGRCRPAPGRTTCSGNHDESRIASRSGRPSTRRLAMLLLLTLRGTPTLYYGDELGMQDVPIPPERAQDPVGQATCRASGLGRDPARTPMPWDADAERRLLPAGRRALAAAGHDLATVNVAAQLADPRSMLTLTRRLLALRRVSPALSVGRTGRWTGPDVPDDCFVFLREADAERMLVALNFSDRAQRIDLPAGSRRRSSSPRTGIATSPTSYVSSSCGPTRGASFPARKLTPPRRTQRGVTDDSPPVPPTPRQGQSRMRCGGAEAERLVRRIAPRLLLGQGGDLVALRWGQRPLGGLDVLRQAAPRSAPRR